VKATIIIVLACLCLNAGSRGASHRFSKKTGTFASLDTIPVCVKKLIHSYPNSVAGYSNNHLILKDGTRLLWDDGIKNKPAKLLLAKPDLKDMFSQKYSTGILKAPPAVNFDPGRVRNEPFFMKMYGASEKEVRKKLNRNNLVPKAGEPKDDGHKNK